MKLEIKSNSNVWCVIVSNQCQQQKISKARVKSNQMAPYNFVKHKIYKGTPNTQVVNEFKQSETDELSQRFVAS